MAEQKEKTSNAELYEQQTDVQSIGSMATGVTGHDDALVLYRKMMGEDITPFSTYRKMRADPTIALAMSVIKSPIKASPWSFESEEDTPDEMVDFIKSQFEGKEDFLKENMLRAIDYGFQSFEKVFEDVAFEGKRRVGIKKLKPLLPDITEILVDDKGNFAGLRQGKTVLAADKCFVSTLEKEGDNLYGVSRLESVKSTWVKWRISDDAATRYDKKVAGVFPMIHYPTGMGIGPDGQKMPNYEIACKIGNRLAAGDVLIIPNDYANSDGLSDDTNKKTKWIIELMEDKGNRQNMFVDRARYLDSNKMRGMLVPERTAIEGQMGTKSEAGEHGDFALLQGEITHGTIVTQLNWHVVDHLLALNYGEEARGKVWIKAAPLQDSFIAFYRELIKAIFADPIAREQLLDSLDFDSVIQKVGLPQSESFENTDVMGDLEGNREPMPGDDPANNTAEKLKELTPKKP